MDKASIIKDAIEYIQELHEQERRIQSEIMELESSNKLIINNNNNSGFNDGYFDHQDLSILLTSKKKKKKMTNQPMYDSAGSSSGSISPIEVLEVSLSFSISIIN